MKISRIVIKDGDIWACGLDSTGCTGKTGSGSTLTLVQLTTTGDYVSMQCGEACLIVQNEAQELFFIGNNQFSQAGVAENTVYNTFQPVDPGTTYSDYLVTYRSVYAILPAA